jgi:hypothetical protein
MRDEREFAMYARSTYRNTLVSSATHASRALDTAGAAVSAMDDEESAGGYWYQPPEVHDPEAYLQYRHFPARGPDAPAYWNWCDGG